MSPSACSCSISDLDMLDIEQSLAYTHNGYSSFMRDFHPRCTLYGNTKENLYDKKELLRIMRDFKKDNNKLKK